MKKRNIVTCILLSIITCGIYGIFWFIWLNDDIYAFANPEKKTSGGIAFLLTLVTCGIYGFFWNYKMGQLLDDGFVQRGQTAQNRGIIYLILSLFGFSIVSYILMQNTLNSTISD